MIVQVGPYPPPIGGISSFIRRMKDILDSKDVENQVWDYSRIKKTEENVINMRLALVPFYIFFKKDVDLIHYNICGMTTKRYITFFNRFFFKNRKKVITLHGDCATLSEKKTRQLIKYLSSFDATICVKSGDKEHLLKHGLSTDVYEIPAFLPPVIHEEDLLETPPEVWDFINSHQPVISANASTLVFINDQDRYGLDMCIDLCALLKVAHPKIGFVFCIPHVDDYEYFKKMKRKITEEGVENNFLLLTKPAQLYPIIMKSDVFVRPTDTDGDAVSVREALYFKIPTVSSDVVPRPKGTVLFHNRDLDDFVAKVRDILDNYKSHKKNIQAIKMQDNFEKIMKVYGKYMK